MTTHNLLALVLKIFGLMLLWYAIEPLIGITGFILSCVFAGNCYFSMVLFPLAQLLVYLVISYALIFNTQPLIERFKLNKGFDGTPLSMHLPPASVLSTGIIIFGGLMVVFSTNGLLRTASNYIYLGPELYDKRLETMYLTVYSFKFITGMLLVLFHKKVARWMERKRISAEENLPDDVV